MNEAHDADAITKISEIAIDRMGASLRTTMVSGKTFAIQRTSDGNDDITDRFVELKPSKEDACEPLSTMTISSAIDYLAVGDIDGINRDGVALTDAIIHVSPREVRVLGPLRDGRDRECFLRATPGKGDIALGGYVDQAAFALALQCDFVPSKERDDLLTLAGNITDEAVRTAVDDGVTQIVGTRGGAKMSGAVKNPWLLSPRRSFPEIELDPVPFVLRVQTNGPGQPSKLALFEADGGQWRVDAIRKIFAFINNDKAADGRAWGIVA